MNAVVEFETGVALVRGEQPLRPAPTPARPANGGAGDVRKKTVPVVKPPAGPSATHWEGGAYVGLQQWLDGAEQGAGVLLQGGDDVRALDGRAHGAGIIAVDFSRIGDGRGYSQAFVLRKRLNYQGRLRALGAVTADQVYAMAGVGFDSFELRADQNPDAALAALKSFTTPYQNGLVGDVGARQEANFVARVRLLERQLLAIAEACERPALASSLSAEDMVITDAIARLKLPIDIFTLDTGRLHAETLQLIVEVKARFGIDVEVFRPDPDAVDAYIASHGRDGFYEGLAERKLCCAVRKLGPLNRALAGRDAWITGQRRDQAVSRQALDEAEYDAARGMQKYNPLADWRWSDVLTYADRFDIPMNALYARGYVSIGCEPCTKAIRPGQDPRQGRWWWEASDSKECGLHAPQASLA